MKTRNFKTACRACAAPVVVKGSTLYIVDDNGELIESDHCRCGEWLRWDFLDGAGEPVGFCPADHVAVDELCRILARVLNRATSQRKGAAA